jgi:translation initiation factor 4A
VSCPFWLNFRLSCQVSSFFYGLAGFDDENRKLLNLRLLIRFCCEDAFPICLKTLTLLIIQSSAQRLCSLFLMSEEADHKVREGDPVRQYYIAVERAQFKLGTLVELLAVLGRRDGLPLLVCCGPRDSLDAVYASVAGSEKFYVSMLHSDLDDSERLTSLETFRLAMSEWNYHNVERSSVDAAEGELRPGRAHALLMTDSCLPSNSLGETSLPGRVMINFDIPSKKEAYSRRMAACLGSPLSVSSTGSVVNSGAGNAGGFIGGGKMAITMVEGDEVAALKSLEESCGIVIDEMPINISELL